jgi:hypothetical protein
MPYNVFISHSMAERDRPLLDTFVAHLQGHGIDCYVAERDWKFGQSLAAKIEEAVARCDCLVAFLTIDGARSSYVNQEIGLAKGRLKPCLPIVEKGVDLHGLQVGAEYLELDHAEPGQCMTILGQQLIRFKSTKETNAAIGWALLAFIAGLAARG